MSTTNHPMKAALVLAALVLALDVQAACAQAPSISVSNQQARGTRRVEIVIQDPVNASETASEALPVSDLLSTPPDGGQIQGTLISGNKRYAVTNTRMLAVGDRIAGHTVAQISLDRVTISRGAHTYELDLTTGQWSAATGSVAE